MCEINQDEQKNVLIDQFVNLQRILSADDTKAEVEYQLRVAEAKLQSMGVITEDLKIKKN